MANAFFSKGLENLWKGNINWSSDDIRVVLVNNTTDAPIVSTDETLADIAAGARVATSPSLSNPIITAGVVTADNVTVPSVTGSTVNSLVIYKHTGVEATSYLIGYVDSTTDASLPYTPTGVDVTIVWNPSGILRII